MKNLLSSLFKKKTENQDKENPAKKPKIDFKSIIEKFFKKRLGNKVKG
jgi:hypothetical protein